MTETTYFERPNLKVTDSQVISGVGVFRTTDVRCVRLYPGYTSWITAFLMISALLVLVCLQTYNQPLREFPLMTSLIAISSAVYFHVMKPTNRVKIEGSFGKANNIAFDCGTEFMCAIQLASALRRVANTNKQNTGPIAGVA